MMNRILLAFIAGLALGAVFGWLLKPAADTYAVLELKQALAQQNARQTAPPPEIQSLADSPQVDATNAPVPPVTASPTTATNISHSPTKMMSAEALQSYHGALREMVDKPRDRKGEWEQPFFNEARDDTWSTAAEDRVRAKVLSNVAAQRFPPKSIECRSSGCRLEYRFRNSDDYEAFDRDYRSNHIFPGTSIMGNGTNSEDGGQVYVEYIQRTGNQP